MVRLFGDEQYDIAYDDMVYMLSKALCGRIGREDGIDQQIISFWNKNISRSNLNRCLIALSENGLSEKSVLVSTPDFNLICKNGTMGRECSHQSNNHKMLRQMHLARGQEKKDIMKKLGLGFEGIPKKDQFYFGGGDDPTKGQVGKWWTPYSESR